MASRHALLSAAADYIGRGWPVFVLGSTKRPVKNCRDCPTVNPDHDGESCDCLTCHGFYAATLDIDRVDAMRRKIRGGLIAIRTGAVSGLAVVDIDPRNGGQLDTDLMNPTYAVHSGNGGWHLYYQHPGGRLAVKLADRAGVDIKADGGYVVAPPSIHPDTRRPYRIAVARPVEEMRAALRAAVMPPQPATPPPVSMSVRHTPYTRTGREVSPAGARSAAARISHPDRLLTSNLDAVLTTPKGGRRHALYGAARGVAKIILAGQLTATEARHALTETGRAAGQSERDIRAAIEGGFRDEGLAA